MATWDLAIVGAGPAGSAAALGALRAAPGLRVALVDRAAFPRDKACGDGIAPQVGDELRALGADVLRGRPGVDRLSITSPCGTHLDVALDRPDHVVPRRIFDALLVDAARAAGAVLLRGRVSGLAGGAHGVVLAGRGAADGLAADVAIGADGADSVVRRALGLRHRPRHTAVALRAYAPAPPGPPVQRIRMLADDWPSYAWSFPLGDGRANVGYGLFAEQLRAARGGRNLLRDRLAAALPEQPPELGTEAVRRLPLSPGRPRPGTGRVLLAGDAAGLVNPLTGEGIWYAVASGARAGAAVAAGDPAGALGRYRAALGRLLAAHLRQTDVLGRLLHRPALFEAGLRASASHPPMARRLIALGLANGRLRPGDLARVGGALVAQAGGGS